MDCPSKPCSKGKRSLGRKRLVEEKLVQSASTSSSRRDVLLEGMNVYIEGSQQGNKEEEGRKGGGGKEGLRRKSPVKPSR